MKLAGEESRHSDEQGSGPDPRAWLPPTRDRRPDSHFRRRAAALGAALLLQGLIFLGLLFAFVPRLISLAPAPVTVSIVPASRPPLRSLPVLPQVSLPGVHAPRVTLPPPILPVQPPPLVRPPLAPAAITPQLHAPPTPSQIAVFEGLVRHALQLSVNSHYPPAAKQHGEQGVAWVHFEYFDGTVSALRLVKSTGLPLLDKAALATVRDAHYPRPPPQLQHLRIALLVYVAFRVSDVHR